MRRFSGRVFRDYAPRDDRHRIGNWLLRRDIGPGASKIEGTIDATQVYKALYLGLFDNDLDAK